jgi:Acetyltransferase (GNAT) domain
MAASPLNAEAGLDWDNWLSSQQARAGFCQTSSWARIHALVNRATSYVIWVERDGSRMAGTLVSIRPSISQGMDIRERFWSHLTGRAAGTLECFEGPVLPCADVREGLTNLLRQVGALADSLRINHIRFVGAPVLAPWAGSAEVREVFRDFGYEERPWLTSVVDLTEAEGSLRRNLEQAARKGIRKSLEGGLVVVRCESRDQFIERFCKAYHETVDADEKGTMAARNEEFWLADSDCHYNFFVVEDANGEIHAFLGTYRYQRVATEIMSGRTTVGRARNMPAQDLLHWEVMLHHKRTGDRYFNLAGYSPNPTNEKELGIRRFKEKWGGREISVPSYTWIHEPGYVRAGRWLQTKIGLA